jgi:2-keto-4-pentenoate hydratase/2-oxohepta-3-ene-1,7-dioic acid hydratase in catechol pathway
LERGGNWSKGKGCDSFAPLGPFLATKEEIYNRIWKDDYIENPNALNVHIYHLRRKLEKNRKANDYFNEMGNLI